MNNGFDFSNIKKNLENAKSKAENTTITRPSSLAPIPITEDESRQQESFIISICPPERVEKKVYNLYMPLSLINRIKKGAKMYSGKDTNANQSAFVEQILDQVLKSMGI